MTGISTHVLDLTSGRPVAGVRIELFDLSTKSPTLLNLKPTLMDALMRQSWHLKMPVQAILSSGSP